MTKKQTIEIIGIIVAAYPSFEKFKDVEQIEAMVNVWANIFQEDDPGLVALAVKKHISTSKWVPSIAEIREIMTEISHPELTPPDLAWSAVSDLLYAIGETDWDNTAQKILPPLVYRVVEVIGWHKLYQLHRGSYAGNRDGMDRVAFMDLYKPLYERTRQAACCPSDLLGNIRSAQLSAGGTQYLEAAMEERRKEDNRLEFIGFRRPALSRVAERQAIGPGNGETET